MAIFFVAAIWPAARRLRAPLSPPASRVPCATVDRGTALFQVCYTEDTVASTLADYRAGAGFEGMFEYAPPDADLTVIARACPTRVL